MNKNKFLKNLLILVNLSLFVCSVLAQSTQTKMTSMQVVPISPKLQTIFVKDGLTANISIKTSQAYALLNRPDCIALRTFNHRLDITRTWASYHDKSCRLARLELYLPNLTELGQTQGGLININQFNPVFSTLNIQSYGDGFIKFNQISGSLERINIKGHSNIAFDGFLNLKGLSVSQQSTVRIRWIKSPLLMVQTKDQAQVQLAGQADRFYVESRSESKVDARFLRAKAVWARSNDKATIMLVALNDLYGDARQKSNIYYFVHPRFKAPYTELSGNILSMVDVPGSLLGFQSAEHN